MGNQSANPEVPIIAIPQKTANQSNFSQNVNRSNRGRSPRSKNHLTMPIRSTRSFFRKKIESGPKTFAFLMTTQ